ncbi:MAG: ATP synthase F0 subunit A [Candidatus Kapaibacterium sp.]|nr:MAG: ATP synthase F0 subunit A [Candidatus Kapabacteria bacterium]
MHADTHQSSQLAQSTSHEAPANASATAPANAAQHGEAAAEAHTAAATTHAAAAGHDAHASHDVPPSEVFTHLLGELGDHHGFVLFGHVADLPIMMWDEGNFHAYSSPAKMEEAGTFTMMKGHPVRKADMKAPKLDLSITNFVLFEWFAMFTILAIGLVVAGRYKKNPKKAPSGIQNILETVVIYLRDEVVYPNIKPRATAERMLPYFLSLFSFILVLNVFGLIPGGHSATGAIGVTAGLAIISFLVINVTAIRESGIGAWFAHLTGGAPLYMAPIMVPIEILSLFIKPFVLTMRLFANMAAGHIVLLAFMGLIFFFKSIFVAPASVAFSVFVYFLEVLAAFLQAYIFTMLTAVFTGMAIGDHAHSDHAHDHH